MFEQQHGADHPKTLLCVTELVELLKSHGKLTKAERLYRRALEGNARTLVCVLNLAQLSGCGAS